MKLVTIRPTMDLQHVEQIPSIMDEIIKTLAKQHPENLRICFTTRPTDKLRAILQRSLEKELPKISITISCKTLVFFYTERTKEVARSLSDHLKQVHGGDNYLTIVQVQYYLNYDLAHTNAGYKQLIQQLQPEEVVFLNYFHESDISRTAFHLSASKFKILYICSNEKEYQEKVVAKNRYRKYSSLRILPVIKNEDGPHIWQEIVPLAKSAP